MPASRSRRAAAKKRRARRLQAEREAIAATTVSAPGSRRWVPPVFITVGLLGVAWLVLYYVAGYRVPVMRDLGDWNLLIAMGLMASSFMIATLWR